MMPNGGPRDGFFYPTLTLQIDNILSKYQGKNMLWLLVLEKGKQCCLWKKSAVPLNNLSSVFEACSYIIIYFAVKTYLLSNCLFIFFFNSFAKCPKVSPLLQGLNKYFIFIFLYFNILFKCVQRPANLIVMSSWLDVVNIRKPYWNVET